jgi:sec-independent protein translocase protein TatA
MPSLGPTELVIILVIVLLIFGPGKLANLGGSLGKSIKDFRRGMQNDDESESGDSAAVDAKAELKSVKKADEAKVSE